MMPDTLVVWSDLDRDFALDGAGDIKVVVNALSVVQSIKNILETMLGQRVMNNNFASTLNLNVFEPIDESTRLLASDEIKNIVEAWDNRAIVDGVTFETNSEQQLVSIAVKIGIRGHDKAFSVEKRFN